MSLEQPDRGGEIIDRVFVLRLRLIEQAALVIGLPVVRADLNGAIVVVEDARHRIRRLPLA